LLSVAQNVKILWHATQKTLLLHLESLVAGRSQTKPEKQLFNRSEQLRWGATSSRRVGID
jgi:hypothetical protein